MSQADLTALSTAYDAAVDIDDWSAALKVLTKIAVRVAASPTRISRSLGGTGNQSLEWSAETVAEQQKFCRQMLAASRIASGGVFQQVPVTYSRVGATDDYS